MTGETVRGDPFIHYWRVTVSLLSHTRVRAAGTAEYVGHPVALVVAETYDMAFAAAKAVRVAYEPLEPILSIQEALANKHYTFPEQIMERGDPDKAIEAAVNRVSGGVSCRICRR